MNLKIFRLQSVGMAEEKAGEEKIVGERTAEEKAGDFNADQITAEPITKPETADTLHELQDRQMQMEEHTAPKNLEKPVKAPRRPVSNDKMTQTSETMPNSPDEELTHADIEAPQYED